VRRFFEQPRRGLTDNPAMTRYLVLGLIFATACSKRANECAADSDCVVPYPFCDVNGEYAASGGIMNVCTVVPDNCPAERCGCTPNATTCTDQTLSVCNSDGKSATETACDLGCSTDGTHCKFFAPSNGLGDALAMAAAEPDIDIPDGFWLYPATGAVENEQGTQHVSVKSIVVSQSSGAALRIFIAHSFKIHNLLVPAASGNPIAFVAVGPITVDGVLQAGAGIIHFGGTLTSTGACTGGSNNRGGGGGGNATAGGNGALRAQLPPAAGALGGLAQAGIFEPLGGGCSGGASDSSNGPGGGGAGGGAIQIVSLTSIGVARGGMVNVGGQGGSDHAGGGAGGTVLLESPSISLLGKITANGGSGGACGFSGANGPQDGTAASGVAGCNGTMTLSGAGGTGSVAPTDGFASPADPGAGGGGSVGRLGVHSRDGSYEHDAQSVISAKVTTESLVLK
jgi:hypothetical protein